MLVNTNKEHSADTLKRGMANISIHDTKSRTKDQMTHFIFQRLDRSVCDLHLKQNDFEA